MIYVIDGYSPTDRPQVLASMFEDRKRLFVDLFGWDVPVIADRFEIDQFDGADTTYVLAVDANGEHEASIRMMPSTRPHMLGSLFEHLCPMGVPVGDGIWETTRLCLPQRHGAARRRELRNALFSVVVDIAIEREISGLTGVIPDRFRKELLAMGWRAEPLGPAVSIQGGPIGAFLVHVAADTPARLGWTGVYTRISGRTGA
jgi:N-acyl-L-homoserine lactone synthetase